MANDKLVKVYIEKSKAGLGYVAGHVYEVTPEEKAKLTQLKVTGPIPGQKPEKEV